MEETLELIKLRVFEYTPSVEAQVKSERNHHMSTTATDRGFGWMGDQARDHANEQVKHLDIAKNSDAERRAHEACKTLR